jgi:FkbM family methyltransferase
MRAAAHLFHPARLAGRFALYASRTRRHWTSVPNAVGFFLSSHLAAQRWPVTGSFRDGSVVMQVRPTDWCAFEEILLEDEYGVVPSLLGGTDAPVVLDLGANVGLFASYVLARWPAARLWSVEAAPTTFAMLRRNREANPALAWTVVHAAVTGRDGEVAFREAAVSTTGRAGAGDTLVRSSTLATLLRMVDAPVDLAKIDIEASEEEVLVTAPLSGVRAVLVEIHPARCDASRVLDALATRYRHRYRLGSRRSTKPVVLATDERCHAPGLEAL